MIPSILNFIVRSFSNSEISSKWYGRDEIFKCIKDSFLLSLTIFILFSWSIVWYLQFFPSFSVQVLIFLHIVVSCSFFLGRIVTKNNDIQLPNGTKNIHPRILIYNMHTGGKVFLQLLLLKLCESFVLRQRKETCGLLWSAESS